MTLLSSARPDQLLSAAQRLEEGAGDLERLSGSVLTATSASWRGEAALAAAGAVSRRARDALTLSRLLRRVAGVLVLLAGRLRAARDVLAAARADAEVVGWTIDEVGRGHPVRRDALLQPSPPALALARQAVEDAALADAAAAAELDELLLEVLANGSASGAGLAGLTAVRAVGASVPLWSFVAPPAPPSLLAPPPDEPPTGAGASAVAAWWAALPPSRQADALQSQPAVLGNLDGIPFAVRDVANRRALTAELTAGGSPERHVAVAAVTECIAAPDRYLVSFDLSGHFRAAVAVGDVDAADHVAVLVPGMGTSVGASLPGLTGSAAALQQQAAELVGAAVAVVAWIGYRTPSVLTVPSQRGADAGGLRLARFVAGLRASRCPGPRAHVTVIGHSYGSTTAGVAARTADIDDLVVVGSPGVEAATARELAGVPPGHVFVGEAADDAVADCGCFGRDPSSRAFGARPLYVGSTPSEGLRGARGHSDYFTPGGTSIRQLAHVVAGLPPDVTTRGTLVPP